MHWFIRFSCIVENESTIQPLSGWQILDLGYQLVSSVIISRITCSSSLNYNWQRSSIVWFVLGSKVQKKIHLIYWHTCPVLSISSRGPSLEIIFLLCLLYKGLLWIIMNSVAQNITTICSLKPIICWLKKNPFNETMVTVLVPFPISIHLIISQNSAQTVNSYNECIMFASFWSVKYHIASILVYWFDKRKIQSCPVDSAVLSQGVLWALPSSHQLTTEHLHSLYEKEKRCSAAPP